MNFHIFILFHLAIAKPKSEEAPVNSILKSDGANKTTYKNNENFTKLSTEHDKINETSNINNERNRIILQNIENNTDFSNHNINFIPLLQRKQNNEFIYRKMNEFVMERRKTHFTMPYFDNNNNYVRNKDIYVTVNKEISLNVRPNDTNRLYDAIPKRELQNVTNFVNYTRDQYNNNLKDNRIKFNIIRHNREPIEGDMLRNPDKDSKEEFLNEINDVSGEFKLTEILRKQNEIIEKLVKIMDNETKIETRERSDFDDLLRDLYNKPPTSTTIEKVRLKLTNTTVKSKDSPLPTVMTLIDETEVREALKNNPYVKRILKMARKKRLDYLASNKN